ncbi:MAG: bifunctional 2-C-methyl-D-erythritol 4-phosphate cytidylyltransferase/2-C-methyl-D-erythritol 2,4-cyclodiphosphate synthase [Hyphomicrobiales bacterium]|nr:bifunctional 2-C-methyl-D-erythritol 4-phosphate cytidylyltransferase/2-C-methyl-D-erythritol 2,4-cyclodiphosphate synthase [Hyphomicrobiales bacterium]
MAGCVALIVAAGRGTRFGGEVPKQYRRLAGEPILRRSLRAFADHPAVDAVRAVIHPDDLALYEAAAEGLATLAPVPGGASRQESVRLGLESLVDDAPDLVLIHDGARPFVDAATIGRVIGALAQADGAIPALPVVDTLKRGDGGRITDTVDRAGLWRAQTPQGFRFAAILEAHRRQADRELTDDAAVAERAGLAVALVDGDERNLKVTSQEDLERAEATMTATETRVGTGFDVHAFDPAKDEVVLCGVAIPHRAGLAGHSDADVGLHALTDAILGAIAAGDIGDHFPPSDPQWRGAASEVFLAKAADLVAARGGAVLAVDLTLICEAPKVAPHRAAMRDNVARILGIDPGRVSVKGTTTEKLGFTGRGEGIAAQAAATVRLPAEP